MYHTEQMPALIRPLTRGDLGAADSLLMRAFATAESFRPVLEREFALQPDCYWLAESGGETVGTIAAVVYGPIAYIGMMGVDPVHQGKGIGTALLETALAHLDAETLLLDATEAGEPLYRRYGFIGEGFSWDLRGTPTGLSGRMIQLIHDPEALISLDAQAFGADRRRVIHRLLAEPGARALQCEGGFLIAQKSVLGPWIANDPATAEALLAHCEGAHCKARAWRIMIPAENESGLALLGSRGFEVRRRVLHMRRGKPFPQPGRAITYGRASFALG